MAFGAFTTINYVHDPRLFLAAIIGAFLGVYIAVEWKKRKEGHDKGK
jgi:hypothetical protein